MDSANLTRKEDILRRFLHPDWVARFDTFKASGYIDSGSILEYFKYTAADISNFNGIVRQLVDIGSNISDSLIERLIEYELG